MLTDDDKQWVNERLDLLAERIEKVEERFAGRLEKVEERFAERIERVETTLLTEFHKWASPIEMRQRSHAAALRAHDAEMESLNDRVKNLEGR